MLCMVQGGSALVACKKGMRSTRFLPQQAGQGTPLRPGGRRRGYPTAPAAGPPPRGGPHGSRQARRPARSAGRSARKCARKKGLIHLRLVSLRSAARIPAPATPRGRLGRRQRVQKVSAVRSLRGRRAAGTAARRCSPRLVAAVAFVCSRSGRRVHVRASAACRRLPREPGPPGVSASSAAR